MVIEPDGRIDLLYLHNPITGPADRLRPGHEEFTSSTDGGRTWSPSVEVGGEVGGIAISTWWIDGDLAADPAGDLYATWDTQTAAGDIGWVAISTDHGSTWSKPARVTDGRTKAVHLVEVVGDGPGTALVGWQTDSSKWGYATWIRPLTAAGAWQGRPVRVSARYANRSIWPGDTFGLAVLADRAVLSWGGALGGNPDSEIHETVVPRT